jgi:DNA-damage-inducible protein J
MPSKASKKAVVGPLAQGSVADRAPKAGARKVVRHRAGAPEDFKTSMLNIRVKEELKREASATLAEIGISLPEAVRVFLGRVVSEQAFPFPLEVPNAETVEALRESRRADRRH